MSIKESLIKLIPFVVSLSNHERNQLNQRLIRKHFGGFTLIETLIVMAISVALVALMVGLYHGVGKSALSLRGGQQEWLMQRQLREQTQVLFNLNAANFQPISSNGKELYLASWYSRNEGSRGKPVITHLVFDETERTLFYQEIVLPAWWMEQKVEFDMSRLQSEISGTPRYKILTGADRCAFKFLSNQAPDLRSSHWVSEWRGPDIPSIMQLQFAKAGHDYVIWFELRDRSAG